MKNPPLQVVSKSLLATYKGGENIVNSGRLTVKVYYWLD